MPPNDTIMSDEIYKSKQMRLREMPKDVYEILIDAQSAQKKKCNCQYSLEQTIYKLVRLTAKSEVGELK